MGNWAPVFQISTLLLVQISSRHFPFRGICGFRSIVESMSLIPDSWSARAIPPMSESVFFCLRLASCVSSQNQAGKSRRSGRASPVRHDGFLHAGFPEDLDEFPQLPQTQPMHGVSAGFDLGKGFFFDCSNYDIKTLLASGLQNQEWEWPFPAIRRIYRRWSLISSIQVGIQHKREHRMGGTNLFHLWPEPAPECRAVGALTFLG